MATGWRLATSTSNDQIFTDASEYDAILRTMSTSQRLLFGFSSNVASTLAVSPSNVVVDADLHVRNQASADSVIVTNQLSVGDIPDIEFAISNIHVGGGFVAGAITSNLIADSNILTRHVADGAVTEAKLAGTLSVPIGGTGNAAFVPGRVLIGNGAGALATSPDLAFSSATRTLAASNVSVTGNVSVGGVPDLEQTLSNLANGSAVLNNAVVTRHLTDSSVVTAKIANAAVTEAKLAGTLSVPIGGTGNTTFASGRVLIGNGTGALATSTDLAFSSASRTLAATNVSVTGNVSVGGVPDLEQTLSNLANGSAVRDNAVVTRHLTDSSVTTPKIANLAATEAKLGNSAVTTAKIANAAVTEPKIGNAAVTTAKIATGAVTEAKLAGTLSVPIGGTGNTTFASGRVLIGNGTGALATSTDLAFSSASRTLAATNVSVTGNVSVGGVPDLEQTLSNLANGVAVRDNAVVTRHMTDSSVTTAKIANAAVTEAKLAGTLSVPIGGTGNTTFVSGRVLIGNGTGALATSADLAFSSATQTLAARNASVTGNVSVGGVPDLEQTLSNLANGSAVRDNAVVTRHVTDLNVTTAKIANAAVTEPKLATSAVTTAKIANAAVTEPKIATSAVTTAKIATGAVTEAKLAGTLSVPTGGTGRTTFASGAILFGGGGGGALKSTANLTYDDNNNNVTTANYTASGRVHTHDDLVIGAPGAQRFRLFVDAANNLVVNSIDASNAETTYVNFADLVSLLSSVTVFTGAP